ncbi:uncharacterized protein B0J16DRAFT_352978 [Fusarium flagelliforme]|uniref:uncharacterized protein n=1 Tax=Fusarium flagelliforme TaxID=2675880 RepID=UPI001E8E659C|nr:uncharacterized protein B0J16DRAFT_352978 [Fusarium flagelliforme]KAH7198415.1 hypothetical protein B0J16DRAFT_352978 [Fusarium flagelliforme]
MEDAPRPERQSLITSTDTEEARKSQDAQINTVAPSLKQSSPSWFKRVGLAIPLLCIPIAYIILIGLMAYLNGRTQSNFGDTVVEVISVASTLWPIAFAAVMGPLLKTLALLGAEKGSTMISLEFLLTSQTTASALKNLLMLRWFRSWTVAVVAMWFLSPLGGQAALRSVNLRATVVTTDIPAMYYLGNNRTRIWSHYRAGAGVFTSGTDTSSKIAGLRTVASASFINSGTSVIHSNGSSPNFDRGVEALGGKWQASRLGHQDAWRNVKIPFLEHLPAYNDADPTAWISVPKDEVVPYASLVGLPVRGGSFDRAGNSTLNMSFHYLTLSCGNEFNGTNMLYNGSTDLFYHDTTKPWELKRQYEYQEAEINMGYPNIWLDLVNDPKLLHLHQQFPDWKEYKPQDEPQAKLQLISGGCVKLDKSSNAKSLPVRLCDIGTSYIDMEVGCSRSTTVADFVCQVNRARRALSFPEGSNLTAMSSMFLSRGVLNELPFLGASRHVAEYGMLDTWLRDPPNALEELGCFSKLQTDIWEQRLSTALNTVTMAALNTTVITGGDGVSLENRDDLWQNTTATWKEFDKSIYTLSVAWYCVTVISTITLFICAVANIVLRQIIKAPDFLDSVAGLTRDSPFIKVPQEGSGMSGSDRLETMRDVKVRICDVYPERAVGRIALTTALDSPKLDWKRTYV